MPKFCLNTDGNRANITRNLLAFIDRLPADKAWQVIIEPLKKDRSARQNRALFGVAYAELEEQTGNEKNDLHWLFCGEFFGWVDKDIIGKTMRVPARTTTTGYDGKRDVIPTDVFAKFYDMVQRKAAEMGLYVSDPDPEYRLNREQPGRFQ